MHTAPMTAAEQAAVAASPRYQERFGRKPVEQMKSVQNANKIVAERIAADMIDIAGAQGGHCLDTDLLLRGWTPELLRAHHDEANRIALAKSGDAL